MTLTQIKAMFTPGSEWLCSRTMPPVVVHGNTGVSTINPRNLVAQPRTVLSAKSQIIWREEGRKEPVYSPWPKASEITEARDGLLRFTYAAFNVVCTYERKA